MRRPPSHRRSARSGPGIWVIPAAYRSRAAAGSSRDPRFARRSASRWTVRSSFPCDPASATVRSGCRSGRAGRPLNGPDWIRSASRAPAGRGTTHTRRRKPSVHDRLRPHQPAACPLGPLRPAFLRRPVRGPAEPPGVPRPARQGAASARAASPHRLPPAASPDPRSRSTPWRRTVPLSTTPCSTSASIEFLRADAVVYRRNP
jgi:hypothetical protein